MTTHCELAARHIDHATLQMWKWLLKEGSFCSVREISLLGAQGCPPRAVRRQLDRLASNNMVRMREVAGKHVTFAVTTTCVAPPGYGWMLKVQIATTDSLQWAALEARHGMCGLPQAVPA
jgi:hypothetical protein